MRCAYSARPFDYCAQCHSVIYEGRRAVYDDQSENFFCGRKCFDDWFEDNYESIKQWYKRRNVSEVDV